MPDRSPQPNVRRRDAATRYPAAFWLAVALTGTGAGLGGGLLMKLLHAVQHACWSYDSGGFVAAAERATAGRRVAVLACAGLFAGLARWLLRLSTGGHGGEICETIWFHAGRFPAVRTAARSVLSIVVVGMGASLGREGALKQAGALAASKLSQWTRLSPSQGRLLAACGAGAGMSAAYNVPFGGALFALEVLLGDVALPLVVPALATSFLAVAVSWMLLPDEPTYRVAAAGLFPPQLAWAVVAGPVLGLVSAGYIQFIGRADSAKPRGWFTVAAPVVAFTGLGLVAIEFPQLLGNGKGVVQLAFTDELSLTLLLALPVLKGVATAAGLASGTPGGLFTPTLTCGALLGGLLGHAWNRLWPGAAPGSYALLGAGAFLAAATQGPVSSVVLLAELTRRVDPLMVPLLAAVATASLVARYLEPRSIYSARIHQGKAAAQEQPGSPGAGFASGGYELVSAATRYVELVGRLLRRRPPAEPLYVVDERGRPLGQLAPDSTVRNLDLAMPLETTTAADLALPVQTLSSHTPPDVARRQARENGSGQLPVIDPDGRLVGVVRADA